MFSLLLSSVCEAQNKISVGKSFYNPVIISVHHVSLAKKFRVYNLMCLYMYKLLNKNACHDVSLLTVVILHLLCTTGNFIAIIPAGYIK